MRILVTGGAGFIGSNLVEALLEDSRVGYVRVLDNLETGFLRNLAAFQDDPRFEFVEGDIRDYKVCLQAAQGMDSISHQAALGSVPRSINDPLLTNEVNVSGTLNIFKAAVENNISKVVFAASSSTYGDHQGLPKMEDHIGKPLSPYAVTKYVNELYADVFKTTYNLDYIGLRYFNVFGPKQDPQGAYAAVIPLFFQAALSNSNPTINGDGTISRDFTFVENAVQANILALFSEQKSALNQIYNVACGQQTTLSELWNLIKSISGTTANAIYGPPRKGDILHSLADISKIKEQLNYRIGVDISKGIEYAYEWYKQNLVS